MKFHPLMSEWAEAIEAQWHEMKEEEAKAVLASWLEENQGQTKEDFSEIQNRLGFHDSDFSDPSYINSLNRMWDLPFELEQLDYSWQINKL